MGGLSSVQFDVLRTLVESAPDAALRNLDSALQSDRSGSPAMAEICRMISLETGRRATRSRVLAPLLPLCVSVPNDLQRLVFPAAAPAMVWRVLQAQSPRWVELAEQALPDEDEPSFACDDQLCLEAAAGVRAAAGPWAEVAARLDAFTPSGAGQFAACLEISPIARRAIAHLSEWTGRLTEERAAAARLCFKDAVALADDNAPRLMEMLTAHLEEPWQVIRLVSAVMDRPNDAFVAASELATFGERLMGDIDRRVKTVVDFNLADGREAGEAAGRAVHVATMEIAAIEESIELARAGSWGQRLMAQKRTLASAVENRLKHVEDAVSVALPLQSGRRNKGPRGHPRLTHDPDRIALTKAEALTAFVPEVRSASAVAGFGAVRARAAEAVEARLNQYVEDLLETIHLQAPEAPRARLYLDAAAELLGLLSGAKVAQIVRRRAAAA
jgi:hypothetical protein